MIRELVARRLEAGRAPFGPRSGDAAALVLALLRPTSKAEHLRTAVALREQLSDRVDAAVSCAFFIGDGALPKGASALDQARAGLLPPERAAAVFEAAGRPVRAAIELETHGARRDASVQWRRVATRAPGDYQRALAFLDVVRTTDDPAERRDAAAHAVHAAEQAADELLRAGERERAFDAYATLLVLGRETGAFEDAIEGYVGATRILRDDNLRRHAVGLLREGIAHAESLGELAAAASLARELAAYGRRLGDAALAAWAGRREAELALADAVRPGTPADVAEQRLLEAASAFARTGAFASVGRVYETLAVSSARVERRAYFAKARERYAAAADVVVEAPDETAPPALPKLWHVDLLEWENQGSVLDVTADLLLDPHEHDVPRHHALFTRIVAAFRDEAPLEADALIAEHLGAAGVYAVLSPLEALARSPAPEVREAAALAFGWCVFKRSFATLGALVDDREARVRRAAEVSIEKLAFPHGIDALVRLARTAKAATTRAAALAALSRIDHDAAAEALVELVRGAGPELQRAAREALDQNPEAGSRATRVARRRGLEM